jgi:hypothetical protein
VCEPFRFIGALDADTVRQPHRFYCHSVCVSIFVLFPTGERMPRGLPVGSGSWCADIFLFLRPCVLGASRGRLGVFHAAWPGLPLVSWGRLAKLPCLHGRLLALFAASCFLVRFACVPLVRRRVGQGPTFVYGRAFVGQPPCRCVMFIGTSRCVLCAEDNTPSDRSPQPIITPAAVKPRALRQPPENGQAIDWLRVARTVQHRTCYWLRRLEQTQQARTTTTAGI